MVGLAKPRRSLECCRPREKTQEGIRIGDGANHLATIADHRLDQDPEVDAFETGAAKN
jgi:hypothetical protein